MDPLQLQSPRTFIRDHKASATEGPGKCHDEVTTLGWEAQAFFERHSHLVLKHWAAPKKHHCKLSGCPLEPKWIL